jgi:endonuclease YncB( thermonuclease family)
MRRSFLGLTFLAAAVTGAAADDSACTSQTTGLIEVRQVIDGGTIALADSRVVRLAGVDVPKAGGAGARALGALKSLVAGRTLRLGLTQTAPDRYGRWHAEVLGADGSSINEGLTRQGFARVVPEEGLSCLSRLLAAEEAARKDRAGLWNGTGFVVHRATDASLERRAGLYELVEGKILSVGHGRSLVFLDFGRDYRRDFTIMVPLSVGQRLPVAVDDLAGRVVRVRGFIESNNGPAIRLDSPAGLELLEENGGGASQG